MSRKYKTLYVDAKCSDLCTVEASGDEGHIKHIGYVPKDLGIGKGDYIFLRIDIETGRILGWPKLTDEDIEEIIQNE